MAKRKKEMVLCSPRDVRNWTMKMIRIVREAHLLNDNKSAAEFWLNRFEDSSMPEGIKPADVLSILYDLIGRVSHHWVKNPNGGPMIRVPVGMEHNFDAEVVKGAA